jgi:tetratricopeptide (TPR) repeat protein
VKALFGSVLAVGLMLPANAGAEPTARFGDAPPASRPTRPARPSAPPSAARPAPKEPWVRASAREEVRRAAEHARRGDALVALSEYNAAIRLDPSFGEAYLALGALREAMRDFAEAERVYDEAARIHDSRAAALAGRARARRALGRETEAFRDLEASLELEPDKARMKALAEWYVERRAWPAALSAWRRLYAALGDANSPERDEARLRIRALAVLAADSDPVLAGRSGEAGWVRQAFASIANRGR